MKRLITILLLFTFVCGCATIPQSLNNKGIIALNITGDDNIPNHYYAYYKLYYTDTKFFLVYGHNDFQLFTNIKPGEYTITKVERYYKRNDLFSGTTEVSIPFTVVANKISILNNELLITFKIDTDQIEKQYFEFVPITPESREDIKIKIKAMDNANIWEFTE